MEPKAERGLIQTPHEPRATVASKRVITLVIVTKKHDLFARRGRPVSAPDCRVKVFPLIEKERAMGVWGWGKKTGWDGVAKQVLPDGTRG